MPGGFAEYVLINHDKVFALSDKLSFEEATFTEPTACAVHGVNRIAPRFGDSILMFGAGPTGIILAQLLRRAGRAAWSSPIPTPTSWTFCASMALPTWWSWTKADPSKHTAEIKAIMPKGFDIVIDATGAASVFESCFHFVHMGSKIVAYGARAADAGTRQPLRHFQPGVHHPRLLLPRPTALAGRWSIWRAARCRSRS